MSDRRRQVFFGARLFDGLTMRDDRALVVEDGAILAIAPTAERPRDVEAVDLAGGVLAPGLVDWQVNGGGGALFNAAPTPETIAAMAAAHRCAGVTSILPTVITDSPAVLAAALLAAAEAARVTPGALGVHVEGPFIDPRRKGVHLAEFIRPMRDRDVEQLVLARSRRGDGRRSARRLRRRRARGHPSLQCDEPTRIARAGPGRRSARRSPDRLRPDRRRAARP